MMAALLAPLPAAVTILLIIAAIIPWGGPAWAEMAVALLPVCGIYFWSVRRPQLMPAVLVFVLGIMLDVLTHGPLGIWACAGLMAALAGRVVRRVQPRIGWTSSAVCLVATLAASTALVGALEAGFAWRPMPALLYAQALLAACLAYPLLAGLLSLLDPLWPAADGRSLFLRGD